MTDVAIASTALQNREAGEDLASQLTKDLKGRPDALIVFASSANDYKQLLSALDEKVHPGTMVGCSSAGEFTTETDGTGRTSVIAIRNPEMRFTASAARNLTDDRKAAAHEIVKDFSGLDSSAFRYRTALVFVDALAGHAQDLVDQLTLATAGMYQFVGGGAGDDGKFQKTHVFVGTEALNNAAVALEILSNKPIGIGAKHGWAPSGEMLRVTESAQSCVVSFNVSPAVEAFEEHAESTTQVFDRANPLPFFLHNVIGMETEDGYKLRVPLGVAERGGIMLAAEMPTGSKAHIMSTQSGSAVDAAAEATQSAVDQVESKGFKPKAALFFDCVATRLRLGRDFGKELDAVANVLDDVPFAGFNSYGQIVRAEGQFSGFHNCTAVVCVFPD